jgi:hypothetical protein
MCKFWKTLFLLVDLGCVAIAAISLFSYAFQLKDASGYSMDGLVTVICVVASICLAVMNHYNKIENIRMHSKGY